ncbi:hypothetical protein LX69_01692 [Breznakibacter xylanolyticus]|uniref:Tetratricopeptide repeat protein n=2 Tax=Breznakibacter xylanolyticus TaxID=990 RepID=A0A2W7N9Y3_9BACT|nr:hypothetical protein LX69_01692 [Breznakibacter xylanolyticus]
MRKFFSIFISLCVIYTIDVHSQSLPVFNRVDSLMLAGSFFQASIECDRVMFNSDSMELNRIALLKKAYAQKSMGNYEKAIELLTQFRPANNHQDSLWVVKFSELALCHFLDKNFESSLAALAGIRNESIKSEQFYDIRLLKIVNLNSLYRFEEAKELMESAFVDCHLDCSQVDMIYRKRYLPKRRNPETAKNLSMIIPGSGHVYSGRFGEGGINFLLNAGALSFGVYHIYYGYFFSGYVIGFTLLHKFHSGGMHRAEILAEAKNLRDMTRFNESVINCFNRNRKIVLMD